MMICLFHLLFLPFLMPLAFPLELKVQIVGWQKVPALRHLLRVSPGNRFAVSLYKRQRGVAVPLPNNGRQMTGHYDIVTFQLPEEWVNEMEESPTGEFVRAGMFTLGIRWPSQSGKVFHIVERSLQFSLTVPTSNFARVELDETNADNAIRVLPMAELEQQPVRHLLFKIASVAPSTSKDDPQPSTVLLLKMIECQKKSRNERWSIGDDSKGQQILLAKNRRVCLGDKYMVYTKRVNLTPAGVLMSEMQTSVNRRPLSCGEALYEPGQINRYQISEAANGNLVCRFYNSQFTPDAIEMLLATERSNVISIWPSVCEAVNRNSQLTQANRGEMGGGQSSSSATVRTSNIAHAAGSRVQQQPEAKSQGIAQQAHPIATFNHPKTSVLPLHQQELPVEPFEFENWEQFEPIDEPSPALTDQEWEEHYGRFLKRKRELVEHSDDGKETKQRKVPTISQSVQHRRLQPPMASEDNNNNDKQPQPNTHQHLPQIKGKQNQGASWAWPDADISDFDGKLEKFLG